MMHAIDCSHLQPYLCEQLGRTKLEQFEQHLDDCSACRKALDESATMDPGWAPVRAVLQPSAETPNWTMEGGTESGRRADVLASVQLSPTDDPASMGRLGGYEVLGVIGRGGMGIVLKALDQALGRKVAVKLLEPSLASVGASRVRFAKEARSMAAISHEHVVPIFGVDEHAGIPYLVMEYVAGGTLEDRLQETGPLEVLSALRIAHQVALALQAAHGCGVIHRDIKPANILLDPGVDRVRVTDFGLARVADDAQLTSSGMVAGTPQYMSPEQVRGEICDERSDLFGLGCLLYAMLTGHSPFRSSSLFGAMQRVVHEAPRPLRPQNAGVPEWLEAFVLRLLAKDQDARFPSAGTVADFLEEELRHLQEPASVAAPARPWMPATSAARRRQGLRLTGLLVFALATAGGLASLAPWLREDPGAARPGGAGAGIARGSLGLFERSEARQDESAQELACAQLIGAIEAHDLELVAKLLPDVDPNSDCLDPNAERRTLAPPRRSPLVCAVRAGSPAIIRLLLDAGAQVNRASVGESTPLMVAAEEGSLELINLLLDEGAEVEAAVLGRGTALSAACAAGQLESAKRLLDQGSDLDRSVDGFGSPLLVAADGGHRAVAVELLARGAQVDVATPGIGTPLSRAVRSGHLEILEALVAAGADIEAFAWGSGTPLMEAVRKQDRELMDWVLERGANLDAGVHGVGLPIVCAVRSGDRPTLAYLLDKGADIDASVHGVGTALMVACSAGSSPTVEYLLQRGADLDASVDGQGTALSEAVTQGAEELVELLLAKGANPNRRADGTDGPLLRAVLHKRAPIARRLLEAGADPDAKGGFGRPSPREAAAGSELAALFPAKR